MASADYYSQRSQVALQSIRRAAQPLPASVGQSPDAFWQFRLQLQDEVLRDPQLGSAVATVRDDIKRQFAIPYFTIDLYLLRLAGRGVIEIGDVYEVQQEMRGELVLNLPQLNVEVDTFVDEGPAG
jgi:hypothetical protein